MERSPNYLFKAVVKLVTTVTESLTCWATR